jgi:transcription elongation GreA/GreB family factor
MQGRQGAFSGADRRRISQDRETFARDFSLGWAHYPGMSRAFVKDQDEPVDELPDRPISPHPNLVTAEGLAHITAELERAQQAHAGAQIAGDRGALARTARDLRYWMSRRATSQLVAAPSDAAQVHFGSTVSIVRDDGRRQSFRIVGEDEADPARGTLSHAAPLARALFGKAIGDTVRVGQSQAEIVEIA